jgi:hypothetical protein
MFHKEARNYLRERERERNYGGSVCVCEKERLCGTMLPERLSRTLKKTYVDN